MTSNSEAGLLTASGKEAEIKKLLSLKAYEDRTNEIFAAEARDEFISEIIEGPKMPLRILRNKFNPNSKILVFLVHGTGMNEFAWAPVLKPLEKNGINAVTFAWRGHSPRLPFEREKLAGTGLMDLVADAEVVLEHYKKEWGIENENVILSGHSFGVFVNNYLAANNKFKAILNFCAGYPNEEFFLQQGVDINNENEITGALGKLWSFSSEEYIKKTLKEAEENRCFQSYREMGDFESYLSELFSLEIPKNYDGPIGKLIGPTSRKAVAEGLLKPPHLLKKKDGLSQQHFFAAINDKMVTPETIRKLADAWDGTFNELPGPHVGTYSPYAEKYIKQIVKYHNLQEDVK